MKFFTAIALFASFLVAQEAAAADEIVEKGKKPGCCRTKEPSYDCGDECGGCFKNYIQKMDFYHTKPVLEGAGKNWNYFFEDLSDAIKADDGVFTADCHGGKIDSTVFTRFFNSTTVRELEGAKFLIYAKAPAEVPKNGDLVVEYEGSGETFKTDQNPYPKEITQPNDYRMAANLFTTIDFQSSLAFSWLLTNDRVYILYSRYTFGWAAGEQYAAFNFVIPVKMRKPCDWHNMKTIVHGTTKQVSWRLEGREVFRVSKVGYLIDRQYMAADFSGQEGPAFPAQIWYGFGTVDSLWAYPACKRSDTCCDCKFPTVRQGLVDMGSELAPPLYNPLLGPPNPAIFWM